MEETDTFDLAVCEYDGNVRTRRRFLSVKAQIGRQRDVETLLLIGVDGRRRRPYMKKSEMDKEGIVLRVTSIGEREKDKEIRRKQSESKV